MLDQACREVLVQGGVNYLGQSWVDPVGVGSDRGVTSRIRGQEPKSVLDLKQTSAKSQRTSPGCSIAEGVQSGP